MALPLAAPSGNRLAGMPAIHSRVQGGGFLNYYLTPDWRFTSSLLYGAGNARNGRSWNWACSAWPSKSARTTGWRSTPA